MSRNHRSGTDLTEAQLAARIRAACEDRAGRLDVDARAFDPGAPASAGVPPAPEHGRSRRRTVLAAAAVVAVGALVAAVALARPGDAPEVIQAATSTEPAPTAVPPLAEPTWLAPSAPPLDLALQSAAWRDERDRTDRLGQLFVNADHGSILVLISASTGSSAAGGGTRVRGQAAWVAPSKEDGDRSTTINWDEGASVEARFVGMDLEQATAILESLEWRSADHTEGFAPPADRTTVLMEEAQAGVASRKAELSYADAASSVSPGQGRQIQIHTTLSADPTIDSLEARFLDPDGGDAELDGRMSSYDDGFGTLTISWLDENGWNAAWIDANKTGVGAAQLREIADALVPTDEAGMQAIKEGRTVGGPATETTTSTTTTEAFVTTTTTEAHVTTTTTELPLATTTTTAEGAVTTTTGVPAAG